MDPKASSIVELSNDLKKHREDIKPLKEQLIEQMKTSGQSIIPVGNACIKLVEKKTRKNVGMKAIYGIIKQKLGEQAESDVRQECEKVRGQAVIKHSLKICESDQGSAE